MSKTSFLIKPLFKVRGVQVSLLMILSLLCSCCFLSYCADSSLRNAGLLPTYTPRPPTTARPTRTPIPTRTAKPTRTAQPTPTVRLTPTAKPAPTRQPTLASRLAATRVASQPTAAATSAPLPSPPPTAAPIACCKYCDPAKSKPCGDGCISLSKTCHQPPGCACSK